MYHISCAISGDGKLDAFHVVQKWKKGKTTEFSNYYYYLIPNQIYCGYYWFTPHRAINTWDSWKIFSWNLSVRQYVWYQMITSDSP